MANIVRRSGEARTNLVPGEWEPFRLMREMLRWDPFSEMTPFVAGERANSFVPSFDVRETKDAYIFKADLPGVQEKDVDINIIGNRLTVSGKREAETRDEGETYYAYERSSGTFARAFTLPDACDAEHVAAELKDGVLTLHLPKRPEMQPKKIEINGIAKRGDVKH